MGLGYLFHYGATNWQHCEAFANPARVSRDSLGTLQGYLNVYYYTQKTQTVKRDHLKAPIVLFERGCYNSIDRIDSEIEQALEVLLIEVQR